MKCKIFSCCSVAKLCPTLCNPMDCSMPAFSVHYQFPELAQSYVHWVHDAIQPSHPRPLLLPPLIFPSIRVFFQWVSSLHWVAGVLELQLQRQSFQWIFRVGFLKDWLVWSPCCSGDSQESYPAPQFKSLSSWALSLLYGLTLTSIHDYWKNHCFD